MERISPPVRAPLTERLIKKAKGVASNLLVKRIIVGVRYTFVELENGRCGIVMTLQGRPVKFPTDAETLVELANSPNGFEASVGWATVNALLQEDNLDKNIPYSKAIPVNADDKVAVVGRITPVINYLEGKCKEVFVFEDKEVCPSVGHSYPWWAEKLLIPQSDVMVTTGVVFANRTVDDLLIYSKKARLRVAIGYSTPMTRLALGPAYYDSLMGIRVKDADGAANIIATGGNTMALRDVVRKVILHRKRDKIAGLVLAAGLSKRMGGTTKALLEFQGRTFLEVVVGKLSDAGVRDIFVVLGHEREKILELAEKKPLLKRWCRFIFNPDYKEGGMLSSIIAGLDRVSDEFDALILYPVDFPLVKTDTIKQLVKEFTKYGSGIISPVYKEKMGHPVLISAGYFDEIRNAPPDRGARAVIHSYEDKPDLRLVDVDDMGVRFDIDTREDYNSRVLQNKVTTKHKTKRAKCKT